MKKFDSINVIPFIDIMLVLLAIVLMTASFINQGKITVNAPTSKTTTALRADDVKRLITVDRDSQIYLDNVKISADALAEEVKRRKDSEQVSLKIDAEAPFALFIKIGDMLRQQKISKVSVLALPEKS